MCMQVMSSAGRPEEAQAITRMQDDLAEFQTRLANKDDELQRVLLMLAERDEQIEALRLQQQRTDSRELSSQDGALQQKVDESSASNEAARVRRSANSPSKDSMVSAVI